MPQDARNLKVPSRGDVDTNWPVVVSISSQPCPHAALDNMLQHARLCPHYRIVPSLRRASCSPKLPCKEINGLVLVDNAITNEEHDALVRIIFISDVHMTRDSIHQVEAVDARLQKRIYETDHWDSVIVKYRETELYSVSRTAAAAIDTVKSVLVELGFDRPLLPPHVIDLHPDGRIDAHIDSVKFSGDLIAGVSLLASATFKLEAASPSDGIPIPGGHSCQFQLAPRSLYVLSGPARYEYAHSVFDISGRRLSLILRDLPPQ